MQKKIKRPEFKKGTVLRYIADENAGLKAKSFLVAVTGKGESSSTFKGIVIARQSDAAWDVGTKVSNWTTSSDTWEIVEMKV